MQITFNGETLETDGQVSITDLLMQAELNPLRVAVEVNFELIPREQHAEYLLENGDRVEVVTLAGGG